jgi:hypothetical protein
MSSKARTSTLTRLSRRELLQRGALIAAAASAPAVLPSEFLASAFAAPERLGTTRAATYTALVQAMAVSPAHRLDPSVAVEATRRFEESYAGMPQVARDHADRVLDDLEASAARSFSEMPAAERCAHLQRTGNPASATPMGGEHRRLRLASESLGLVAVVLSTGDSSPQEVTL